MLCEGPTEYDLLSPDFKTKRSDFLSTFFDIPTNYYHDKFIAELSTLDSVENYKEINLWFEYDLFCHINMIAAISHLQKLGFEKPIYLICSGRVDTDGDLKGFSELTKGQLHDLFVNKINIKKEDIELADTLWKIYNSNLHRQFKKYVTRPSSFPYLASCLSAHLKRFPSQHNGLNLLEVHTLNMITQRKIKSKHQLLGYILQYQGYYGFGDTQLKHMIDRLDFLFNEEDSYLVLNEKGKGALGKTANFYDQLKDDSQFGGIYKYSLVYDINTRKLMPIKNENSRI